jgi:hypothetical protein
MVPAAGHALSEPGITAELVAVMDRLRLQPALAAAAGRAGGARAL